MELGQDTLDVGFLNEPLAPGAGIPQAGRAEVVNLPGQPPGVHGDAADGLLGEDGAICQWPFTYGSSPTFVQ